MNSTAMAAWAAAAMTALVLAGCGGGAADPQTSTCSLTNPSGCGGNPPTVPVTPPVPPAPADPATQAASVGLLFSSTELKSAGAAGTEVTVTALVKNAANTALPGASIAFSADSGILTAADAVTDKNGQAKVKLGIGGSNANRRITVLAKVGAQNGAGTVEVVGTTLALGGPVVISQGASADFTATLRDSAERAISGATLTLSAKNGNALAVKGGAPAVTNALGQVLLSLKGTQLGAEAVSVSGLGASVSKALSVEGTELRITPAVGSDAGGAELLKEVATGACQPVDIRYEKNNVGQAGSVTLSTSRGRLYTDNTCLRPLSGALTLVNGDAQRSYVASPNAGVASLSAVAGNGPTALSRVEFVAPLSQASTLTVQAEPAVIGSNAGAAQTERSALTAVVRDGSAANNLVKGATVVFSILADPSGGALAQPFSVTTGSDGVARATYVAGPSDSGTDGVLIQAQIQGMGTAVSGALSRLTVARKALSIQFGTGNTVLDYSPSLLQQEFSVLVSDGAGNGVAGVDISVAAWPTHYRKGYHQFVTDPPTTAGGAVDLDKGQWQMAPTFYTCANEDILRKGIYEPAYDQNNNGVLDPGIPITVGSSGKTDALGLTKIALNYPRDRGHWVRVELTVRGSVAGTEALARSALWLPALASDYDDRRVAPPGATSPYGSGACASAF
ncbi:MULTISPECIES: Ig-like domain-containing protein [unclassified Janthinobacterium]|uniref:Ig-like domain-containing protein n=1 Tax=unclassified Janthinobacterium TaxID=2610881 RepID=UPI0012F82D10|nr:MULTISPECIES: Ig-like domain-containing protein [unclassified Janthinobacterium]MEC5160726.1 hypothetical protein [Janthinobacterium sp. CG_S6]